MTGPSPARWTERPLLAIGEFSRYAGLSVRMLRHYDERGVLVPAEVDPATGYRRYTPDQLRQAGRIRALRDAGCGIPAIAELLPLYATPDVLRLRLADHVAQLDAGAAQIAARRQLAVSLAASLEESPAEVGERTFPGARVLRLRRTVACYPAEGELWAELRDLLSPPPGVRPEALGSLVGATYYDDEFRDDDVEMAVWRDVHGVSGVPAGFEVVELPAQRVAWTTHRGPFDTIGLAGEALGAWVATNGRRRVGPLFNLYVVGPGRTQDPGEWVTEVNVPIE
ncbi:MerR family transcriptional regulator [Quadrisphaera oryzae]|uniref:MerR family transcriptional regulator n=1 Tax=Quadrisphaera TaxID=317661 RepID=UPI001648AFF7|nr:MerR family transcriptional regulator [Quadrisphaera sp. RL12-1S]MBC3762307.1 MerR family transcriptional regulator [Quadrisphaera sp. RL12-1S]